MLELQETIGRIAGILSLLGFAPYAIAVCQGKTHPNRATWWIWTVVGAVLCASYYSSGARYSVWVPVSYMVGPLLTALLSLKYGKGGWNKFDLACLVGAAISLVFWWLSGSPLQAITMNIAIDLLGALPTIKKSYYEPWTEDLLSWVLFFAGNTLNLFAIGHWSLLTSIYPLYLFCISAIITALIARSKVTFRRNKVS